MSGVEVLTAREVPLGGLRAMTVRRTLPHRERSFIGAWCFADHYGPTTVDGPGMDVAPHPHTGLQTVSWLFEGTIEHRDSAGVHQLVRPGALNLMTGGRGIAHSEVSEQSTVLHGVQLWVALPDGARDADRGFDRFAPDPVDLHGPDGQVAGTARVFLGSLAGSVSPVTTHTPLLGAELVLSPGSRVDLPVAAAYEHGALLDSGSVEVDGVPLPAAALGCRDAGPTHLTLAAGPQGARLLLLGGAPFEEEVVMWWNFVGRSHADIVQFRADWEAGTDRFGEVVGYAGERSRIPAPPLPAVRLRPRGRRHGPC